ncbi:hypothetical protein N007_14405 [Alicyclobacillus acidoterrestris ATCC 49025]|nr:hypothetical protein N007_14405 [Alicyclobacillus acidoterrestris ATCC 49025]
MIQTYMQVLFSTLPMQNRKTFANTEDTREEKKGQPTQATPFIFDL